MAGGEVDVGGGGGQGGDGGFVDCGGIVLGIHSLSFEVSAVAGAFHIVYRPLCRTTIIAIGIISIVGIVVVVLNGGKVPPFLIGTK